MPNKQEPKIKAPIAPITTSSVRKVVQNNDPTQIARNINPFGYNQFQDFLSKKNMVGDPRMATNEGRKAYTDELIKEYNSGENIKKYPSLAITPESIEAVQKYHQLTDPSLKVDKWVGPETSQLRYPSYTTKAEVKSYDPKNPNFQVPVKDTIDVTYGNKQYKLASDKFNKGAMKREDFIDPVTKEFPFKTPVATPIIQQRKKGGLISKIKGYEDGGSTSDNSKQVAALAGMGAGIIGQYGSQAIDKAAMDEQGRYKRKIYEDDPTGIKTGTSKVLNVGTLSGGVEGAGKGAAMGASFGPEGALIGAGVGLLAGSVKGTIQANRDAKSIQADADAIEAEKLAAKNAQQQAAIQASIDKQLADRAQGLKDGGTVEETARLQKKTVYPAVKKVIKAPMASKTNAIVIDKKGLEEQKKTLGLKDGGKIEGKGTGTSDSITATVKENSFVVPAKNADKAELIRKVILPPSSKKKANLNQHNGSKVRLSNGEHLFTPNEVEKIEDELGDDALDRLAPNAAKTEDVIEGMGLYPGGPTPNKKTQGSTEKKEVKSETNKYKSVRKVPKITPEYLEIINTELPVNQVEAEISPNGSLDVSEQIGVDKTTGKQVTPFDLNKLGNVAEYAIPMLQAGYGLSQLKKLGKRPVGELDKDYLASISKAQSNVELANAQAKYGFTPEEQTLLNNQRAEATSAGRYAARNLSGGSAANAFNMERSLINQSTGMGLKAAVENRNLMLQKQGIAQDKQAYLDAMIANKASMSRQLFGDKMNAWQQNQQAGSGLLAAGLNNMIGAKRYNDELAALKETGVIRNSAYNTLGQ